MASKAPIFITGATGYVGGHFLREIRRRGWRVRALARRVPPGRVGGVEWVRGDLRRAGGWMRALNGCRAAVHLATATLPDCERDPATGAAVILDGLRNLLEAIRKAGVRRLALASTSEVYGDPSRLPVRENAPVHPLSVYGFLKACAEAMALRAHAQGGTSVCILRFFNLYGVAANGASRDTALNLFARRILEGKPVVIHRSRANSRDFVHVKDAVRALVAAVERPQIEGIFNIGSGRETPLLAAARRLGRQVGRRVAVDFRPHEGRLRRMRAEVRRARRELGFSARVPLEAGLTEILRTERRCFRS
ncbi:MAG: NAD(P)-dependent oxidoreductase [Verrucomicrobiae bacterium]|nr:NAD(P)-dependent oxidoreductase [Verrucomicrobiae bacterium]